jgi:hypothetical protein
MCVNCAAAGSSYAIGAAATARAIGGPALLRMFFRRSPGRERRVIPPRPTPAREWPRYAVGFVSYVALGVAWPRLLDPVIGPLYLFAAIYAVPVRVRRLLWGWKQRRASADASVPLPLVLSPGR